MGGVCSRFKRRVEELNERHPIDVMRKLQMKLCPLFWVLGGPCSGKTILCGRLARRYQFHHIDIDKLLREELTKSDEWNDIRGKTGKGHIRLLPREYIIGIIQHEVLTYCFTCRGFLLEGYPRTVSQSEELIREVGPPSIIFYFHASLHSMKKRLRHERPALAEVGLEDEATYIKIYTFQKMFYPLLVKFKDATIRLDTDGDVESVFTQLITIFNNFLKEKKTKFPIHSLQA